MEQIAVLRTDEAYRLMHELRSPPPCWSPSCAMRRGGA